MYILYVSEGLDDPVTTPGFEEANFGSKEAFNRTLNYVFNEATILFPNKIWFMLQTKITFQKNYIYSCWEIIRTDSIANLEIA